MPEAEHLLDESEVRSFLSGLAFVREFSINVVSLKPGSVTVDPGGQSLRVPSAMTTVFGSAMP
jgi:hypothetical protein